MPVNETPKRLTKMQQERQTRALRLWQYMLSLDVGGKHKTGKLRREVTRTQAVDAIVFPCGCAMPKPPKPGWPLIQPCVKHVKATGEFQAYHMRAEAPPDEVEVVTRGRRAVLFKVEDD